MSLLEDLEGGKVWRPCQVSFRVAGVFRRRDPIPEVMTLTCS